MATFQLKANGNFIFFSLKNAFSFILLLKTILCSLSQPTDQGSFKLNAILLKNQIKIYYYQ
jgi:hypothetical protein